MPNPQHRDFDFSAPKQKAVEDARKAQAQIVRECADSGNEPPPYLLSELIGKGSFGRVYRASDTRTKPHRLVAVKIISIEEGDTLSPGAADTFNDILKEVNTLKLLGSSGARNINIVLDSLLVGQSVWIVTEYCAGGSVASLMRPTGGLPEKWIIPILREVAEAVYWVHRQGIIHRDIKCANVLITDDGSIQLCDFGVAGIMETKFDKRSTVTGTLQWMAPELFDVTVSYGMEVDIWAFGSMAFEVASGLPPNATTNIDIPHFGSYLKQYCPRLEGDKYSDELKSLVAFCLVDDPKKRPRIEEVQQHQYIANTHDQYPTASLSKLVSAYKLWEAQGGIRRSLFSAGGAQGSAAVDDESQDANDDWVFDQDDSSDQLVPENSADAQAVYDAYDVKPAESSAAAQRRGRRRPPKNMPQLKGPLEKVFDPNTISNYGDNARAFYGRQASPPASGSDLPLRDTSEHSTVRESLIDLDASLGGDTLTRFGDAETIKPGGARASTSGLGEVDRRKTQDWTFPSMPAVSESHEDEPYGGFSNGAALDNNPMPQPTRVFHPTEDPLGGHRAAPPVPVSMPNRDSTLSLIDLDASVVDSPDVVYPLPAVPHPLSIDTTSSTASYPRSNRVSTLSLIDLDASIVDITRPSTAGSYPFSVDSTPVGQSNRASNFSLIDLDASYVNSADITRPTTAGSTTSPGSLNDSTPFDLEYEIQSLPTQSYREPSMYVTANEDDDVTTPSDITQSITSLRDNTPPSTSSSPPQVVVEDERLLPSSPITTSASRDSSLPRAPSALSHSVAFSFSAPDTTRSVAIVPPLPPLPSPPSANALQGQGSREELKHELQSMIASLNEHLQHTAECLAALPVRQVDKREQRWTNGRMGEVV